MPDVTQDFAEEIRQRIESTDKVLTESSERARVELGKLRRTRRWVVFASGLVALGAGFGLGAALTPRGA